MNLCESLYSFPVLSHIFLYEEIVLIFKPTIFKILAQIDFELEKFWTLEKQCGTYIM